MANHMKSDEVNECKNSHGLKERQISEASTALPSSQPMSREVSPEIDREPSDEFANFPNFGDNYVGFLDFVDQVYGSGFSRPKGCNEGEKSVLSLIGLSIGSFYRVCVCISIFVTVAAAILMPASVILLPAACLCLYEVVRYTSKDAASTASAQECTARSSAEDFPDFGDDYPGLLEFIDQNYGSGFNDLPDEGMPPMSNSAQSPAPAQECSARSSAEDFPDFGDNYPGFLEFIDNNYGSGFNNLPDEGMPSMSNSAQSPAPSRKKRRALSIVDGLFLPALIGMFMYALLNSLSFSITAGALTVSWLIIGHYIEHAWSEDFNKEKTSSSKDGEKEEGDSQKKAQ